MDQTTKRQIEDRLRGQWSQASNNILSRFTTVCRADLDSATSVDDLVRRIADKSSYSERYVEESIGELAGVGARSTSEFQSGQPFGQHQPGAREQ